MRTLLHRSLLALILASILALLATSPAAAAPPGKAPARLEPGPARVVQTVVVRDRPAGSKSGGLKLEAGRTVEVLLVAGPWARVLVGKREGWVPRSTLEQAPAPPAEQAAAPAEAGVPAVEPDAAAGEPGEPGCTAGGDCAARAPRARAAAGRPAGTKRLKVAIYTLDVQGQIDRRVAVLVTDSLVAEVRKLDRVSAISMSEIEAMLSHAEQKRMLGCEADQCLIELGGALGVDLILTGNLGIVGDSHLFNLRAIDINGMQVHGRVSKRLKAGDGEEFLEAIGPAVEALFPDHPLREGFRRGVAPEVARKLSPPPLSPAWFWTTAGLAVVTAGVGAGFGLASRSTRGDWDALARRAQQQPVGGDEFQRLRDRMDSQVALADGLYAAGGALALAAGALALFTDWRGERETRLSLHPVLALTPRQGWLGGVALGW